MIFKWLLIAGLVFLLSACQTYQLNDGWPEPLPERKLFIDAYLDKRDLTSATDAQLSYHLGWIKKFYLGTTLYPNGWINASEKYIASLNSADERIIMTDRMEKLGIIIANEWASENGVRLINSANIATWASALRTAAERSEQWSFLLMVEADVRQLKNGGLLARDINYERYFQDEAFDDF